MLLKEGNVLPLKWKWDRIAALYPDPEQISRVAEIKTATGIVSRFFSKVYTLPEPNSSV